MPYRHPQTTYVVYRGEDVVGIGSDVELAEKLETTVQVIRQSTAPTVIARAARHDDSRQLVGVRLTPEDLA